MKKSGMWTAALAAATLSCMGKPEILDVNVEVTNEQGIANLSQPVRVRDEVKNLAGALVYQVEGANNSYLTLGLELNEKPLPERHEMLNGLDNSNGPGSHRSALVGELVLVLQTARALNYAHKDAQKQRRQLMGETRNVHKYCVTMEQMTDSYIRVPMGIVGIASDEIKIRTSASLERLFERYVVRKFGRQEGYEVWMPKTAINLCGEDFQGSVCPIDREMLSEKLWMHANMPVWEIKGSCDPYDRRSWQR